MKLKKWALIAEIVGAAGVILSLIFVGYQLKANSEILAAQAVFDLRESNSLMSRDMITNAQFAEMISRGYDDYDSLTDVERWRFDFWVEEVLTHRMTAWKFAQQGLIDVEEIDTWQTSTCALLSLPGARKVWAQDRPWLRSDFREDIEQLCFGN